MQEHEHLRIGHLSKEGPQIEEIVAVEEDRPAELRLEVLLEGARRALGVSVRPYLEAEALEILCRRVQASRGAASVPHARDGRFLER